MADAAVPITNTLFPPPPVFYKAFTGPALARLAELEVRVDGARIDVDAEHVDGGAGSSDGAAPGQLSGEERKELDELRVTLGKPRADWVEEDGRWMLFGQMYTRDPHIPTPAQIGLPPLLPADEDPQKSLTRLHHSLLHTLVKLLDVLTGTARTPGELEDAGRASEGDQYIQHLSNLAATMVVVSNQLRAPQAEATLVLLLEKQLADRRAATAKLKAKTAEVAETLRALRAAPL
ncbi:hypothetical protein Q5752_006075 [Cryptotrichosporon argae]